MPSCVIRFCPPLARPLAASASASSPPSVASPARAFAAAAAAVACPPCPSAVAAVAACLLLLPAAFLPVRLSASRLRSTAALHRMVVSPSARARLSMRLCAWLADGWTTGSLAMMARCQSAHPPTASCRRSLRRPRRLLRAPRAHRKGGGLGVHARGRQPGVVRRGDRSGGAGRSRRDHVQGRPRAR